MKKKRILYVSSELIPYTPPTEVSESCFNLVRRVNKNSQIRLFMPRYGIINERRHQLHEVIRLSGINLNINDMDMPLIIKVASIPKERMQVYFIDNEDYFKRKSIFTDENDIPFIDNDERAIFFAKGVFETVKRLNWSPDIIHVYGTLSFLLPLYLKEYYKGDEFFKETKIVTSLYDNKFKESLSSDLVMKISHDKIPSEKLKNLNQPIFENLFKNTIDNSDGLIKSSKFIHEDLEKYLEASKKPFLDYQSEDMVLESILKFYKDL